MESPEKNPAIELEAAEKLILKWDSVTSVEGREHMIFKGDRLEADRYLHAIDEIQRSMESFIISSTDHPRKIDSCVVQIAMARLQDEFRHILVTYTNPNESSENLITTWLEDESRNIASSHSNSIETHSHNDPNSSTCWSSVTASSADFKTAHESTLDEVSFSREELGEGSSTSYRSTNSIREIDLIPWKAIYDLRCIAERMITAGYLHECIQVYVSVRKHILAANFGCLEIESLSMGNVWRLGRDAIKQNIQWWIRGAKVCVRILFAREKRLCDQIFEGKGLGAVTNDACFMEIVKGPMIELFNFPEAISIRSPSPKDLFLILDLHDALTNFLTDVDLVIGSNFSESVRVQAAEILLRLANAARGILSEFVNTLQSDRSITRVYGGRIHPLTRYVMNYIYLLSDYKQTIMDLIVLNPLMGSQISGDPMAPEIDFPDRENQSPFALHLLWIIMILQVNLERKSNYCKDDSLSHIFLMNNLHYIVQRVEGSPVLFKMIGDDYLMRNLTLKFKQEAMIYEKLTWAKILHCLRNEGLHGVWVSIRVLRERFNTFNSMFTKVHEVQSTWSVPDPQLRQELRISILEKLIPAYRSFEGRFRDRIERGYHPEMYIKYSVEDLEIAVLDFFKGHPISLHTR